jgi:hypothetical protein
MPSRQQQSLDASGILNGEPQHEHAARPDAGQPQDQCEASQTTPPVEEQIAPAANTRTAHQLSAQANHQANDGQARSRDCVLVVSRRTFTTIGEELARACPCVSSRTNYVSVISGF